MDWVVSLTGDETDLRELARVWNTAEITIMKDNDSYVLKSSHFTSLTSAQEVREKAGELMLPINAGIKIVLGADKPIEIAYPMQIMPDGTKRVSISLNETARTRVIVSISIPNADGTVKTENPADPTVSFYALAKSDPHVAKMCQYINLDLNSWFTLYNILEILEEDRFKPVMRGGVHKKKADNFTHTADNYRILGVKSRHAKDKKGSPPSNPMTLPEAQGFIKTLIREWLDDKKKKYT